MTAMNETHYPGSATAAPHAMVRSHWRALIILCSGIVLASCGGGEKTRRDALPAAAEREWPQVTPANPGDANAVLMRALGLVGTPYRYGGNTPEGGFDCSGLVTYVYKDMLDLRLPRSSRELAQVQGPKIAPERLATADLVFFGSGGNVSHVGIYIGEGRFVHAPSTGGTVRLDRLDGTYWRKNYSGSKRVLR